MQTAGTAVRALKPTWAVAVALILVATVTGTADPHDSATVAATKARFERWLASAKLSETFAVEKVRWGSRPDAGRHRSRRGTACLGQIGRCSQNPPGACQPLLSRWF